MTADTFPVPITDDRLLADLRAVVEQQHVALARAQDETYSSQQELLRRMTTAEAEVLRLQRRADEQQALITHKTEAHAEAVRRMVLAESENGTLREALSRVRSLLVDIRDHWDCNEDGHRYGTGCRSCDATTILSVLDEEIPR